MSASGLLHSDAAFVRDLVKRRAAVVLDESKDYLIELRLGQVVRETGASSISELVTQARQPGSEKAIKIVEALVTHETFFFRDLYPFEILRKHVLPDLVTARSRTRSLTIWSAACSSGQEPYSIAMLLLEHFPEAAKWVRIVATDISEAILSRAREAKFRPMEVNRGLPSSHLVKYFERAGVDWKLKSVVRDMVEFRPLNLLDMGTFSLRPDVIFMRNVLIYFDAATKREILRRARAMLAPDGAFVLGSAETTLNIDEEWERVAIENSAYYRIRKGAV